MSEILIGLTMATTAPLLAGLYLFLAMRRH